MSDRTSCRLFSAIFEHLAKLPRSEEIDAFTQKMWELQSEYDFSVLDMDRNEDLIALGLARKMVQGDAGYEAEYPDTCIYKGEEGF